MDKSEMVVYFSHETIGGQVPKNILDYAKDTFTRFEVEFLPNSIVKVKVPKGELEVVKSVKKQVHQLIREVEKENSVLALKLARRYRV